MAESDRVTWECLFTWHQDDWLNIACTSGASFAVWVLLGFFHSASAIVAYDDSIHHIYAAQTLYRIPSPNAFHSNLSAIRYNATHILGLPCGLPIAIRILSLLCLGNWSIASVLFSLTSSIAASLLFKRMLIAWKFVKDPVWTSCLLSVFPLRYFSYRCILSNDSVYLSCVFMAFIAYRGTRLAPLFWSIAIATLFSEQGIVLSLSFAFGFFMFGHYSKAGYVLRAWLMGVAPTMIIQLISIRRPFAFFRSRFSVGLGFSWIPFKALIWGMQGVYGLPVFHTYFIVFGSASIGLLFLWPFSFAVTAFVIATIVYVSILDFGQFFRAAAVLEVFTVLIGLDSFFQSNRFSRNFFVVCLVVASLAVTVSSLRAPTFSPRFLELFLHNQL